MRFPDGFMWGAATAGHQVEGDNRNSDTWFLENVTPTIFKEKSGRACNSYQRWRDDVDLAIAIGLNTYRYSVEWARVEPDPGRFDEAALQHYVDIAAYCHSRGLRTIVTFNHFTSPHWFAKQAGWLNPEAPALFARYCGHVAHAMRDLMDYAVTLNEPNLPELLSWMPIPDFVHDLEAATLDAAATAAGVAKYRASNVVRTDEYEEHKRGMLAGHALARTAIRAAAPGVPVGVSLAIIDDQVVGEDASLRDRKRSEVYGAWLAQAKADDFLGVQNYERAVYDGKGLVPPPSDAPRNHLGGEVYPPSLAGAVRYAFAETGKPILVTENGYTGEDEFRAWYIPEVLRHLNDVLAEGVPILGYTHWSLLDNFEWIFGYEPKYGLAAIDPVTFDRVPKHSAAVYGAIAKANAIG